MKEIKAAKMGDICTLINSDRGSNYPDKYAQTREGYCLFLNTGNVRRGYFDFSDVMFISEGLHNKLGGGSMFQGDIALTIRGTLGNAAVYNGERHYGAVRINSAMIIVRPYDGVLPRYLLHFLLSPNFSTYIDGFSRGSAQPHLRASDILGIDVPICDTPHQHRIVAKIDSLFARSSRARDELAHIPRLIERYRQAVLEAAFRQVGPTIELGSLIECFDTGKNLRCEERPPQPHERGIVKVSAVSWGEFDPLASKVPPKDTILPDTTIIRPGDFLISRANTLELVGACVIVGKSVPNNLYLSDKVLRLRLPDDAKPWVLWFLRSPEGRRQIEELATGNQLSMRNISQNALRSIKLPYPDLVERQRILDQIGRGFDAIRIASDEVRRASSHIDRLDQSILDKAFTGKLVQQDPAEEPASQLLDRIKAARDAAPKAKRGRKAGNNQLKT